MLKLLQSWFAQRRVKSPAYQFPAEWDKRYPLEEQYFRDISKEDPFLNWGKIVWWNAGLVSREIQTAAEIAFAGGDLQLAEEILTRALTIASRLEEEQIFQQHCGERANLEVGRAKQCKAYAQVLRDGIWDAGLALDGLDCAEQWLFNRVENPRWDEMIKGCALNSLRFAHTALADQSKERIWKRLSRLTSHQEMPLWTNVMKETTDLSKANIIVNFLRCCPHAYNNSWDGNPLFHLELALIVLRLRGEPAQNMKLKNVRDLILGN